MTLTEEQRAAIHAVSGLLTAIGCPQCHSYLQKNYTHHIEVIRAMTDSSEHFSDATKMIGFDLEKAREAIEEAVDRLSQKIGDEDGPIWEKEPEKAAVLQTLLDEIAHLEKWMIKNRDAATELQYQLDDAVKENERLRARDKQNAAAIVAMADGAKQYVLSTHAIIKVVFDEADSLVDYCEKLEKIVIAKDARIQELKAENINLETLNEGLLENGNDLRSRAQTAEARIQKLDALLNEADQCRRSLLDQVMKVANQRDKAEVRIQELEDALTEYQRLGKTIAGKMPCLVLHGDCSRCSAKMREVCGALEQIAGGKIGPEDAKPHCWQITEERILAIENAISSCVLIERYTGQDLQHETAVLRGMLEEVE